MALLWRVSDHRRPWTFTLASPKKSPVCCWPFEKELHILRRRKWANAGRKVGNRTAAAATIIDYFVLILYLRINIVGPSSVYSFPPLGNLYHLAQAVARRPTASRSLNPIKYFEAPVKSAHVRYVAEAGPVAPLVAGRHSGRHFEQVVSSQLNLFALRRDVPFSCRLSGSAPKNYLTSFLPHGL
ncbi:hypothetical protein EVAR_16769_1 [Eumeta japonica]|uniref:Uncharacterized protein n=1 Tax=Eumeta variegata TaxID=151549 RepID=A0A4C1ULA3_EUMVA|nr:hypothetical protein EVAR_16769_1 [Eumeta japonica]